MRSWPPVSCVKAAAISASANFKSAAAAMIAGGACSGATPRRAPPNASRDARTHASAAELWPIALGRLRRTLLHHGVEQRAERGDGYRADHESDESEGRHA